MVAALFEPAALTAVPRTIVAIPARDEAAVIAATLRALGRQRTLSGEPQPVELLLLVNNTTDATATLARTEAARLPHLRLAVREKHWSAQRSGVAYARRAVMDWAAEVAGAGGIVVSADADTRPAPDWLHELTAPLRAGIAPASGGRILLEPGELAGLPSAVRRTHLLDSGYRWWSGQLSATLNPQPHDPWPHHWQHFGASLALTVPAYRAVGGVPLVDHLEDVALVQALQQRDLSVRHTVRARSYTSARRSGRVPVGLSTQLEEWSAGPEAWHVPGAAEVMALACAEAALRVAWSGEPYGLTKLAQQWQISPDDLAAALRCPHFGKALEQAHAARLAGGWSQRFRPVPVQQALQQIRLELALLRAGGADRQTRPSAVLPSRSVQAVRSSRSNR
ncbi:glycosyltransferase [Deinococcus radiophilus]|uniref:Glycosyltransferase n=3 Tax=Deinococcus radiophilus TaxID=32062 RepID=A0A431VQT8_9DEIO|nr:glycosyltransferase [Deinococcus radiophilus]RTR25511.1 glycosyltransferase [Deinococcus radiophilus]UFA51755.1 glycosyltransferase [Deinococcus radiophilus]